MASSLDQDVVNQLKEVNNMLINIDDFFGNLEGKDYETLTRDMTPLEKARFDITISYAYNSLFWMYMRSLGEDPNEHKIKEEIDRIKSQGQRLREIQDRPKRPTINTEAAGRMIRHGINKNKRKRQTEAEENWENEEEEAKASNSNK